MWPLSKIIKLNLFYSLVLGKIKHIIFVTIRYILTSCMNYTKSPINKLFKLVHYVSHFNIITELLQELLSSRVQFLS